MATLIHLIRIYLLDNKTEKKTLLLEIEKSFSGINSFNSIFFPKDSSDHRFKYLDGLKAILMFWIVYFHEHLSGGSPFSSRRVGSSTIFRFFSTEYYILEKNPLFNEIYFMIGGNLGHLVN